MSEESEKVAATGDEPSMEDILSSIRSILSDEEQEENAKKETSESDSTQEAAPESQPDIEDNQEGTTALSEAKDQNDTDPDIEEDDADTQSEPESMSEALSVPMPEPMEDILELTPDMVANPDVMSQSTFQSSQDLLSELARAILDRRDMGISAGTDVTLEDMVREMVKPILREWLDRNLPYMIERLVKKEIDHMINRAERLHF